MFGFAIQDGGGGGDCNELPRHYDIVETKLSEFIFMIPKTQFKNQELSKFQESKIRSIKIQGSSKESREDSIKISIKRVFSKY